MATVGAVVAFTLCAFWPWVYWSPYLIAGAAFFALPPRFRTRENAMTIGWSVGFAIAMLFWTWKWL